MPQAERRAHRHPQGGSGISHGHALGEALALLKKAFFLVELGQRCARGDVERPVAGAAPVTLKPSTVPVLDDVVACAVPAPGGTPGALQDAQGLGLGTSRLNRLHQLVELAFRQCRDLRKQGLERLDLHGRNLL